MNSFSSIAIALTLIGTIIVTASDAMASATGCDNRQHSDKVADPNAISADITLPYGYLCHLVDTRDKDITEQRAAYTSTAGIYSPLVKDICNWRIDFIYYDKNGNEYLRDKGETVEGCNKGASRDIAEKKTLPEYGSKTCAKLFIEDKLKYTQCHTINE